MPIQGDAVPVNQFVQFHVVHFRRRPAAAEYQVDVRPGLQYVV